MLATVVLDFDPYLRFAGLAVPLRAVVIAVGIVFAIVIAAALARRWPLLTSDDLLYVAIGGVPGAVIGGRVVYALAHIDYYLNDPLALFDPAKGSLSLLGAVIGGSVTAMLVARLFGAPTRTWSDIAAIPLLLLIAYGKLGQLLAGGGQGTAWDGPWSIAFAGPGPWISSSPTVPAHPSQAYEGLWALLGVPVLLVLDRRVSGSLRPGYTFLAAVLWWLVGRFAIGFTWRDEPVLGPLGGEQLLTLVCLAGFSLVALREIRTSESSLSSSR